VRQLLLLLNGDVRTFCNLKKKIDVRLNARILLENGDFKVCGLEVVCSYI